MLTNLYHLAEYSLWCQVENSLLPVNLAIVYKRTSFSRFFQYGFPYHVGDSNMIFKDKLKSTPE